MATTPKLSAAARREAVGWAKDCTGRQMSTNDAICYVIGAYEGGLAQFVADVEVLG